MTVLPVPGDVWAVRTGGLAARLIRLGASIRYLLTKSGNGYADLDNHVVIVTHQTDGVWWGIEGKPGGVGFADLTRYINDLGTVSNHDQPKTDEQRAQIATLVPEVIGIQYAWTAIFEAAATDLHLPALFQQNWNGNGIPGHVICSSLAQWLYLHVGLKAPKQGEYTQPSDWTAFIEDKGWQ